MSNENKDAKLNLRLTSSNKAMLKTKARSMNLSLSDYFVALAQADKSALLKQATKSEINEQTRQLAQIGNNINQLARWLNTFEKLTTSHKYQLMIEQSRDALNEINHKIERLF